MSVITPATDRSGIGKGSIMWIRSGYGFNWNKVVSVYTVSAKVVLSPRPFSFSYPGRHRTGDSWPWNSPKRRWNAAESHISHTHTGAFRHITEETLNRRFELYPSPTHHTPSLTHMCLLIFLQSTAKDTLPFIDRIFGSLCCIHPQP